MSEQNNILPIGINKLTGDKVAVSGKQFSDENYSAVEKAKVNSLPADVSGDLQAIRDLIAFDIAALKSSVPVSGDNLNKLHLRIAFLEALLDTAPDTDLLINTYNEIKIAFNNFPEGLNLFSLINSKISFGLSSSRPDPTLNSGSYFLDQTGLYQSNGSIWNQVSYTKLDIDNLLTSKVDKIIGKQLSTNDFDSAYKNKLDNIEAFATKNDTDSNLRNRSNHTGFQSSSTIYDFDSSVRASILDDSTISLSKTYSSNKVITEIQNAISALKGNPTSNGDTLVELENRLIILENLLSSSADADNIINKYNEILQVFQNFPESSNLLLELNKRVQFGVSTNIPSPSASNNGFMWFDETGGYLSNSVSWVKLFYSKTDVESYVASNSFPSGTGSQYISGNGTLKDFSSSVKSSLLSGYTQPSDVRVQAVLDPLDSLLSALLKLDSKVNIWTASTSSGMTSLSNARIGDWCVRIDTNPYSIYRLDQAPASILANWKIVSGVDTSSSTGGIVNQNLINWTGGNPALANNIIDGKIGVFTNAASFDSVANAVLLTPNSIPNNNGQVYWDFLSLKNRTNVDFLRRNYSVSFQYRVANGSAIKGNGIYFFYSTKIIPISGASTSTGGYIIFLNETTNRIEIYYDGVLASFASISTLADGSTHSVSISIQDNVISVSIDGVIIINQYTDSNRQADSGRYIGLGANTDSNWAQHYVYSLKITSLGTVDYSSVSKSDVYSKLKSTLISGDGIQITFDDVNQVATIKENRPLKTLNLKSPDNAGNISITTDDIPEGLGSNKYYNDSKGLDLLNNKLQAGSNVDISAVNGKVVVSVPNIPSSNLAPALIKSRYESNINTNAFTDSYKSQLDNLPQSLYTSTTFIKQQVETVFQPYIDVDVSSINWDNLAGVKLMAEVNLTSANVNLQYRLIDTSGNPVSSAVYDWHNFYRYQQTTYGSDNQLNVNSGYLSWRGLTDNGVYPLSFDIDFKYFGVGKDYYVKGEGQYFDVGTGYGFVVEASGTVKYTNKISKIRIFTNTGKIKGNFRIFTLNKNLPTASATQSIYESVESVESIESYANSSALAKAFSFGYNQIVSRFRYLWDSVFIQNDPVVMYSMRRLTQVYKGPCITARRVSDQVTLDIGFLCNGSFDDLSLLDFAGTSDVEVVKWYDQSGNSNDLIRFGATAVPKIVRGGVVQTINSKTCVNFLSTEALDMSLDLSKTIDIKTKGLSIVNRQQLGTTKARTVTSSGLNGLYFTRGSRQSSLIDGIGFWQGAGDALSNPNSLNGEAATTAVINHSVVHNKSSCVLYRDGNRLPNAAMSPNTTNPFKFALNGNGNSQALEPSDVSHFEFILISGSISDSQVSSWNSLTT